MEMTFQEAYQRLEEIYTSLKSDDLFDIDQIVALQKEAKKLYDFCQEKIKKVEENFDEGDLDSSE